MVRDLSRVARGGRPLVGDALRAVAELALARVRHALTPVRALPLRERPVPQPPLSPRQRAVVCRIRYVVPRVARRLPWRADCLVQALAARRWLAVHGIVGVIRMGGRIGPSGAFEAHAWLTVGDDIVTGWDIERLDEFAPFPLERAWPGH